MKLRASDPASVPGSLSPVPSVLEAVPHRPPILGVERVLSVGNGRARTARRVGPPLARPGEDPPAPGRPVGDVEPEGRLWELALIEGLAQTAAVLHHGTAHAAGRRLKRGMLVGVRRFHVRRAPRTGERVEYEVELIKELPPLSVTRGTARVGAEVVAEGELKFYVEEER